MKVGIVGSRTITVSNLEKYISRDDEIVSGGAAGVDRCAADFAKKHGIQLTEFLPEYARYGRAAPIIRNKKIVDYSDRIIVFWNGFSKGTLSVIQYAKKAGKPCEVVICR